MVTAGTIHKAPMPHAAQRFMKPSMSNSSPVSGDLGSTAYLHLPEERVNAPVPVLVKHGVEMTKGIIEGDHHTKNTNPGYIRNPLGGFYTSRVGAGGLIGGASKSSRDLVGAVQVMR